MKVLITGGAGYLGAELTSKLVSNSSIEEIRIYDNLKNHNYNLFLHNQSGWIEKVKFVKGDILDHHTLGKAMDGIDCVYHLAAEVSTPFSEIGHHLFEQVNHWGTAGVVRAAEKANVSQFIYASSVSVYGSDDETKTVSSPTNPSTIYGFSKLRGEEHVAVLEDVCNTQIVRCGNVYGYGRAMRFDAVLNRFMFEAQFNGRISIHGDGNQHRPFIHIQDVAHALASLLGREESRTFNLVQNNYSILDIVEALKVVYPELEMIFISQHLKLRELIVSIDRELNSSLGITERPLIDRLMEFKGQFHF